MTHRDEVNMLCRAIVEMMYAAPHDLCGDHRTFYGKRIGDAFAAASNMFPVQMAAALTEKNKAAKGPVT